MHLRELIFQGVLGADKPSRLRPDGSLARLSLPVGVSVQDVHDLVSACLFPLYLSEEQTARLQFGDGVKIAAVLESKRGIFRVIRRTDSASVRLQRKTKKGYEDLASGASEVQSLLQEKLNIPRIQVFFPLHLWRFDTEDIPQLQAGAEFGDDPRIPEVVEMYLTALEVESLEDEVKNLEGRIHDGKKALGQGEQVRDKLQRAKDKLDEIAVEEMSDEEIELLQKKEERFSEFRGELERLQKQEDAELDQIRRLIPEMPLRVPRFWIGIAVAIGALMVSFLLHETHRILALAAIPGFALGGFELLHYFNNMGQASVHTVRLESIRRRINQVCEEDILFREHIDHLLLHAGVDDEAELQQRIPKAKKLRHVIKKLEEKREKIERDPGYRKARKELDSLEEQLKELEEQRQELPSFVMNSFQLESDLKSMNVDPVEVREQSAERARNAGHAGNDKKPTSFERLQSVAEWTDQWNGSELDGNTRTTWSKICGHVLSDRFDDVDLTSEGKLKVGALTTEQLELWQRTRSSEVHAVQAALALALHVNGHRSRSNQMPFSSVWIEDPGVAMTPGHAKKFDSVFKSAAKKSQIVICRTSK